MRLYKILFVIVLFMFSLGASALPIPGKKFSDLYCMATNVFYEARGDGERSKMLVALVTANRAIRRGRSVCAVVYRPHQFSWTSSPPPIDKKNQFERRAWAESMLIARKVITHMRRRELHKIDFSRGATHYHAKPASGRGRPGWASKMMLLGRAGSHLYYSEAANSFR